MQPKEGLYRVSMTYNKVPLDVLKKWNKLSGDAVSTGTKLIVGYLKVSKDQSPLASQAINNSSVVVTKTTEQKKTKTTEPKEVITKTDDTKKVKEVPPPINPPKDNTPAQIKTSGTINFNGGKFKGLYNDQAKNKSTVIESGSAATFKTTSGWQDGKYYCFHNTATPGTIVKVTNNATGKSIYAKVLDAIPDIKQNSGLLLRLSNSAAEELGATDSKFDCQISYAK
jgi:rare lipoprotein A (peptidoglycan hydrolase)